MSGSTAVSEPLYSSLGGDPDLGGIVELFVNEMPDRVATVLEQLDNSDWEGLRRSTHQLKGAAGSYGFDAISPSAAEVETAVSNGEPEQRIRETVVELVGLCNRATSGTPL
jgi:HPt (histidine-containing phosphotransfer) domain-containing protein